MSEPYTAFSPLDRISHWLGQLCGYLLLLMVLLAGLVVVLRYGFAIGSIALQEAVLYLHGAVFTIGAGYTLLHQGHVRVDIFYRHWSTRRKALVDLAGYLLLLLPIALFFGFTSWNYVMVSWARWEGSGEAGGLPLVYLQKSLLLALVVGLILQAVAEISRCIMTLRGAKS
ncbi:TRAP transporter small permease subunit [Ferrimonas lipolytica]|uniref:TRAP transporter small permease protein n=1 Tax=Ferrimonas lipolytica TaxID=2724191 RepID=A0A6H1U9U1_9GAMM|nr:TRAP transporter small permease subunit [Ferrimonas lipolytica]QIZ75598.1 TRAP transporter small permease subunit [Ferrimonas lipolytica]